MTQDVATALDPGVAPEQIEDYFGFDDFKTFYLPDGKQHMKFKVMNEGDRARFQKLTNKDIKVSRTGGDAMIATDVAQERHELIKMSVVDWFMFGRSKPTDDVHQIPFSLSAGPLNLESWLKRANPKIVDDLELAIRMANPWMQQDMTVDEINKEISRLEDLKIEVQKRDAAK